MNLIYDNLIYSLQQAGGISTYWSELSKRLVRDNVDVNFIESSNNNIVRAEFNIDSKKIINDRNYPLILNRFLPVSLPHINRKFIFHSSYNRTISNKKAIEVMTIHDFVHEKFYGGLRQILHSYQKKASINKARIIISVSENTKRDLLDLHPEIDSNNVKVIYNGVSNDFYRIPETAIENPYLLFIGSREHYKNFQFVIKLLKELPDFQLYIVGKPFTQSENELLIAIDGRYKLFNNINNSILNNLYNRAFALLYPSSYEGFGIPLLEAMKCGLPFIALNKSSIPEVAGRAGILVDDLDVDLFTESLNKIKKNRQIYVNEGLQQVKQFSWEKCYKETMAVYKDLA